MKWATRAGVHVDRAACAWLIRRHVDPRATFVFVDDPSHVPVDATPFDMRGVELGHHGGDCTFETILRHYDLADPVLWKIAERLVVSPHTIKTHVNRTMAKLGAHDRAQLVVIAYETGLVVPPSADRAR